MHTNCAWQRDSLHPFGVDPMFLYTSPMYDPSVAIGKESPLMLTLMLMLFLYFVLIEHSHRQIGQPLTSYGLQKL